MVNILNSRAIFLKIWKQQKAEAAGFGSRALNFRALMDCLDQENLNKLMEAISLSVCERNILVI